MSLTGLPTEINLNDTTPNPKPDSFNAEVQAGAPYTDPNGSGLLVRDTSLCYRVPPIGGAFVITADYDVSIADSGNFLICNSASPLTLTLDSAVPAFPYAAQGVWWVLIRNLGAGAVTLDPNGLNLDGSASTVTVNQGDAYVISTDGTGYYSGVVALASGGGGGFSNPMTTLGDIIYENSTPAAARLAGNTTTTRKFLRQTGTGSASAAPAWDVLVAGDVPNIAESQVTSLVSDLALKAPLASPGLTGTPTAPTAAGGTNTTQIATTAFVEGEISALATKAGVQQESYVYAADSGTANAYAVTLSPAPSIVAGSKVVFKAANANTGASTLAVNGGSAKNIYKKTSASLVSGDILANQIIEVVYDGTNFQLTGNGATGSSPVVIGFVVNNGAAGNNVGPMLQPTRAGQITKCAIVTKSSDGTTGLTFRIKQNGADIFSSDPTVAAGTAAGTTSSSTSLTSSPLTVAASDVFQIDILSGSPNWAFTAQLET